MNYSSIIIQFKSQKSINEAYSIQLTDIKDTMKLLEGTKLEAARLELIEVLASVNTLLFKYKELKQGVLR